MATPGENLRINGDRLWLSMHEMALVGPGLTAASAPRAGVRGA